MSPLTNKKLNISLILLSSFIIFNLCVVSCATSKPISPDKERILFEKEMSKKNRVGSKAADFEYIDGEDNIVSLYHTKTGSKGIVLLFYDPDCSHCLETIEILKSNQDLSEAIKNEKITLMATDIQGDKQLWELTRKSLPEEWLKAFNIDNIEDRDAYWFKSLPAIYFLTPDYKVKIKEPNL